MNAISKTVTLVGLAIALAGTATSAHTLPLARSAENSLDQGPIFIGQLSDKPDLALLAKASAAFVQRDRYQTESEMVVKATSGSTNVTASARMTTIVQSPNKFRAEITFSQTDSTSDVKSIVVSDGKQVWMYRPDLKQYALVPYKTFAQADDDYWIGLSSLWFMEIPADVRKPIAEGALTNPEVLKELGLASNNQSLKGGTQNTGGQSIYAYEFTDKDGFIIGALVEPETAALKQIQLRGKSAGYVIDITERILRRTADPAITANTFKFTPPLGTKRVKTLAIGPL